MNTASSPLPVVVLISGRGSNLKSIIDAAANGRLTVEIRAVISNRPTASGLQYAEQAGIPTEIIDHTLYKDRAAFDQALQNSIERCQPALVILAGFMRILTTEFVHHYRGRMLNIHPSLLPDFPGLNTHQQVLDSGRRKHGASIHFVTETTDGGPVILQAHVPVFTDDTADDLAERVLAQEHRLYPIAIQWFAEHRLTLDTRGHAVLDDIVLTQPKRLPAETDITC